MTEPTYAIPSRAALRKLIQRILATESDLAAFLIDYFPEVSARLTAAMDREQRINLLFERESEQRIHLALCNANPGTSSRYYRSGGEPLWMVPHVRNPDFTGRAEVLRRLRDALFAESDSDLPRAQVLSGMGGVGKTQVAAEYAYRHRSSYRSVFWVAADSEIVLREGLAAIAYRLRLVDPRDPVELAITASQRYLEENTGWLLVFDSADQPELLRPYWPQCSHGHRLITTRAVSCRVLGIARVEQLGELTPDEALAFLKQRSERTESNAEERDCAVELTRELGYLPLALEQAAAYICANVTRFRDYLRAYRSQRLLILEQGRRFAPRYGNSVATTWQLNFQLAGESSPASAEVLYACAFLYPTGIPEELLVIGAAHLGGALAQELAEISHPIPLDAVLEPLLRYSLLRRVAESSLLHIHRMVQEAVKHAMPPALQMQWLCRVLLAVEKAFPTGTFSTWPQCQRLLPHVRAIAEALGKTPSPLRMRSAGLLFNRVGLFLSEQASYVEAERFLMAARPHFDQSGSETDPALVENTGYLASVYHCQGRYAEAEQHYQLVREHRLRVSGEESLSYAQSLQSLAALYHDQARYAQAETLCRQALAIRQRLLGEKDAELANSYHNLAAILARQQRLAEAQPMYLRAIELENNGPTPHHENIPSSLVYSVRPLVINKEILPLYLQALEIRRQVHGEQHPQVAVSLHNLATLYAMLHQHTLAEAHYEQALDIWEQLLGPHHPKVATCLIHLADLYAQMGRSVEAEHLYKRALVIRKEALGAKHQKVATALEHMAVLCAVQRRAREAWRLYSEALVILSEHLPMGHSELERIRDSMTALEACT